jgi:hypothetical protein
VSGSRLKRVKEEQSKRTGNHSAFNINKKNFPGRWKNQTLAILINVLEIQ